MPRLAKTTRGVSPRILQTRSCSCGYTLYLPPKMAGVAVCPKCRTRTRVADLGAGAGVGTRTRERGDKSARGSRREKFKLIPKDKPGGRNPN